MLTKKKPRYQLRSRKSSQGDENLDDEIDDPHRIIYS